MAATPAAWKSLRRLNDEDMGTPVVRRNGAVQSVPDSRGPATECSHASATRSTLDVSVNAGGAAWSGARTGVQLWKLNVQQGDAKAESVSAHTNAYVSRDRATDQRVVHQTPPR